VSATAKPIGSWKTAAVMIDDWKLAIFKRHLDDAGYKYEQMEGLTQGTILLRVKYEYVAALHTVVDAAQAECRKATKP
jgi:hypothetical protein